MARKTLSEFQAKTLLFSYLHIPYTGVQVTKGFENSAISSLDATKRYIVKVDEGVKKRFKKGLVKLDADVVVARGFIDELFNKGYHQVLIEEYLPHNQDEEKYLSVERIRDGFQVLYSAKGGVDIEENEETIKKVLIPYDVIAREAKQSHAISSSSLESNDASLRDRHVAAAPRDDIKMIVDGLGVQFDFLEKLLEVCKLYHFSFVEINPLVVQDDQIYILDVAAEVDTAGEFFAKEWSSKHFTSSSTRSKTDEEKAIEIMAEKSPASLKYEIINSDGSIFVLLSGGGASIVVADEVYQQGYGKELANYGEYSGNPTEEETYLYTKHLLNSLLKSKAKKKVLIIGGGVANFTDIRKTFLGVIRALSEVQKELHEQEVKVFVRRGGPHQKEGLAHMAEFLRSAGLYGDVTGPEKMLTSVVDEAIKCLSDSNF